MIKSLSDNASSVYDVLRTIHNANRHPDRVIRPSQLQSISLPRDRWNAGLKELLDQQLVEHLEAGYRLKDKELTDLKKLDID